MKAPSPPPTPDPYKTAAAQQMANVEVAIANTYLQNADEDRPDGTVRFVATGDTLTTYTYDGSGNSTGSRAVPKFKKITALTNKGQQAFDLQQDIAIQFNTVASLQAGYMQNNLQYQVTPGSLPARNAKPVAPTLTTTPPTAGALTESIDPGDLTTHVTTVQDAIFDRLNYQLDIERNARITLLSHQGIFPGSTAYEREMLALDRKSNDGRTQAILAALQEQTRIVQTSGMIGEFANAAQRQKLDMAMLVIEIQNKSLIGQFQALLEAANYADTVRQLDLQETFAIRAQSVNEVASLMHGGQVNIPQFSQYRAGVIDQTPVAQSVYQSAAMDMQKWQTKVQQQQSMMGGIMGLAGNLISMPMMFSDRRLKTDIELLARDERGVGWYQWRYLWDAPGTRRFGVMAQEVPWAAVEVGGFLAVDYRRI